MVLMALLVPIALVLAPDAPVRAAPPELGAGQATVARYWQGALGLIGAIEQAASRVSGPGLNDTQRAEVLGELRQIADVLGSVATRKRPLAREIEGYLDFADTRRGKLPGLRELRFQMVRSIASDLWGKLGRLRTIVERSQVMRLNGAGGTAGPLDDLVGTQGSLIDLLWPATPQPGPESRAMLQEIATYDRAMADELARTARTVDAVIASLAID